MRLQYFRSLCTDGVTMFVVLPVPPDASLQYFRTQYTNGVISSQAYTILHYCCDACGHHPHMPLQLWGRAQKEVSSGKLLQVRACVCVWRGGGHHPHMPLQLWGRVQN